MNLIRFNFSPETRSVGRFKAAAIWRSVIVGLISLCGSCGALRAGVYLSSRVFTTNDLPYIWTDEAMPATYKLRAKITGVPGYDGGFHAATSYNNNWMPLDTCPPPGSYLLTLYWIKWDANGNGTVGPMANFNIQVLAPDTYLQPVNTTVFHSVGPQVQSYAVPQSANCVVITAWGGGGAGFYSDSNGVRAGGAGASVTAACNVNPGDILAVRVASGGLTGAAGAGWPGGGSGTYYHGGGYSRVQLPTADVWAGGGGASNDSICAGSDGGTPNALAGGGAAGYGGTATQGGIGGSGGGSPGTAGQGGSGHTGGGGGYFGGGGGGYGMTNYQGATYYVDGGAGGGSSVILGNGNVTQYTTAINADQNGHGGGNGGVIIRAFHIQTTVFPYGVYRRPGF